MSDIEYSDSGFEADVFLALAQRVWPRVFDVSAAKAA